MIEKAKLPESGADAGRPARPAVEGWQPIGTVPKDGRMVLVYPSSCWTDDTEFDYEVTYWDCDTEALYQSCAPDDFTGYTHWMPLPLPPDALAVPSLAAIGQRVRDFSAGVDAGVQASVPSSAVDQAVEQISAAIRTPVHAESTQDGDHFTHRLAAPSSAPTTPGTSKSASESPNSPNE